MNKQLSQYNLDDVSKLYENYKLEQVKFEHKSFDTFTLEEERRYLDDLLKKMQTSRLLFS